MNSVLIEFWYSKQLDFKLKKKTIQIFSFDTTIAILPFVVIRGVFHRNGFPIFDSMRAQKKNRKNRARARDLYSGILFA